MNPKCRSCSSWLGRAKYHRHYSSRILCGSGPRRRDCSTCLIAHRDGTYPEGVNLLLTDSTLHMSHRPREAGQVFRGDCVHIDVESIPGGHFGDLENY